MNKNYIKKIAIATIAVIAIIAIAVLPIFSYFFYDMIIIVTFGLCWYLVEGRYKENKIDEKEYEASKKVDFHNNSLYGYLLNNPFSVRGRIGRLRFLQSLIIMIILSCLLYMFNLIFFNVSEFMLLIEFILFILIDIKIFTLTIKRFHDFNISGLTVVLCIVVSAAILCFFIYFNINDIWYSFYLSPIISLTIFILLFFKKGTKGKNKYGQDPLQTQSIK